MQDAKTLRLAAVPLDEATLKQFIRYQELLVDQMADAAGAEWAGRYAFAHTKATEETKLDAVILQRLRAMVADVAGRRATLRTLNERLETAVLTETRRAAAQREIERLASTADWVARYGEGTVTLLLAHEAQLVALHRRLATLEGGGHLHSPQ